MSQFLHQWFLHNHKHNNWIPLRPFVAFASLLVANDLYCLTKKSFSMYDIGSWQELISYSGGSRISRGGGANPGQPSQIFPKNCMKLKEIEPGGGGRRPSRPLRSATVMVVAETVVTSENWKFDYIEGVIFSYILLAILCDVHYRSLIKFNLMIFIGGYFELTISPISH